MTTPLAHPPAAAEPHREANATVIEHLEELRRRLIRCLVAILLGAAVGLAQAEALVRWLKRPADAWLPTLAFFSPTEAVVAYMKVAVVFGIVAAMPVILYQLWQFVRPGLNARERLYGVALVGWGTLLFLAGAWLAYAIFLPLCLRLLLTVGSSTLTPVISINRYLSFVTGVMLVCGAVFEWPLVIFFLTKLGVVTPAGLRRYRGMAIIGLVAAAAVLSPTTDAISLLVMAGPLLVLYELSIGVSVLAGRGR